VRRRALRPLGLALPAVTGRCAPQTTLARVQQCWPKAVGPALSAEATPVAEREGTVTVACRSAVWAHELDLLSGELLDQLNAALGPAGGGRAVRRFAFVTGSAGRR